MMRLGQLQGRVFLVIAICTAVAACIGSGKGPALYVLGAFPHPDNNATPQSGMRVLEVKPARLPGYLDTTDLVTRGAGGLLVASRKGRWAERLSEGFTHALISDLARCLPNMVVTDIPPLERPARQVLVDVEMFEATANSNVVLVARWAVTDGARRPLASERISIAVSSPVTSDPAVVSAMTQAIQDLAAHIAQAAARQTECLHEA